MKASLLNKLDILQDRFEELTALLGDGEVIADQTKIPRLFQGIRRTRAGRANL